MARRYKIIDYERVLRELERALRLRRPRKGKGLFD